MQCVAGLSSRDSSGSKIRVELLSCLSTSTVIGGEKALLKLGTVPGVVG